MLMPLIWMFAWSGKRMNDVMPYFNLKHLIWSLYFDSKSSSLSLKDNRWFFLPFWRLPINRVFFTQLFGWIILRLHIKHWSVSFSYFLHMHSLWKRYPQCTHLNIFFSFSSTTFLHQQKLSCKWVTWSIYIFDFSCSFFLRTSRFL